MHTIPSSSGGALGTSSTRAVASLNGPFAVADLDGTAGPDVAVAVAGMNGLSVLLGSGTGGLAAGQTVPNSRPVSRLTAADLNGDSSPDLATIVTGDVEFYVYFNRNNNSQTYMRQLHGLPAGHYAYAISNGDFDCDGNMDLVFGTTGNNRIAVYYGDGQGDFSAFATVSTPAEPRELASGDVDGDGNIDIIYSDQNGEVFVLPGTGTRALTTASQHIPGPQATAEFQLADINNDGKTDIAIVHQYKSIMTLINATP